MEGKGGAFEGKMVGLATVSVGCLKGKPLVEVEESEDWLRSGDRFRSRSAVAVVTANICVDSCRGISLVS